MELILTFDIQYWSNSNIEDGVYPRVWVPDAGGEVAGPDLAADSVPAGPDEFSGTPYAYIRTHFGLEFSILEFDIGVYWSPISAGTPLLCMANVKIVNVLLTNLGIAYV